MVGIFTPPPPGGGNIASTDYKFTSTDKSFVPYTYAGVLPNDLLQDVPSKPNSCITFAVVTSLYDLLRDMVLQHVRLQNHKRITGLGTHTTTAQR